MNNANDNLTNAFRIVKQTLDEASILLSDLDDQLTNDESPFKSLHTGYEIGTESSNSLNVGEKWLKKFAMRYFLPKSQKNEYEYLLGIGVAYNFENSPGESPKLILGIIQNEIPITNNEKYYYWWIPFLYDSKSLHKYEPNMSSRSELKAKEWYKVDPSPCNEHNLPLFESGHLYFMDLLDVKTKEEVNLLAEELKSRYKTIFK